MDNFSSDEWDLLEKQSEKVNANLPYIRDGAVDIKIWRSSSIRILYILKEPYDLTYPLTEWLADASDSGYYSKSHKMWNSVLYWTKTIKNQFLNGGEDAFERKPDHQLMKEIAVVNIKKYDGRSSSENEDLATYFNRHWESIKGQINKLQPTFIVCGGTYDIVRNKLIDSAMPIEKSFGTLKDSSTPVIAMTHPGALITPHVTTYAVQALTRLAIQRSENKTILTPN